MSSSGLLLGAPQVNPQLKSTGWLALGALISFLNEGSQLKSTGLVNLKRSQILRSCG